MDPPAAAMDLHALQASLLQMQNQLDQFREEFLLNYAKINVIHEFLVQIFGVQLIRSVYKYGKLGSKRDVEPLFDAVQTYQARTMQVVVKKEVEEPILPAPADAPVPKAQDSLNQPSVASQESASTSPINNSNCDPRLAHLYSLDDSNRSVLWQYFNVSFINPSMGLRRYNIRTCICKTCGSAVSGKIERLRNHIQFKCAITDGRKREGYINRTVDVVAQFRTTLTALTAPGPQGKRHISTKTPKYASAVCKKCGRNVTPPRLACMKEHLFLQCPKNTSYITKTRIKPPTKTPPERKTCPECGLSVNATWISKHMMIHKGIKRYTCPECGKKFRRNSHLKNHLRTHRRPERPETGADPVADKNKT